MAQNQSQNHSILLVDDDVLLSTMYQKVFEAEGHRVIAVHDGEKAIEAMAKEAPDLIVLDMMMPRVNGIEFLELLRGTKKDLQNVKNKSALAKMQAMPEAKKVPVIAFSMLGHDPEMIGRAKKLGILEFVPKSEVDLKNLAAKVNKILRGRGS